MQIERSPSPPARQPDLARRLAELLRLAPLFAGIGSRSSTALGSSPRFRGPRIRSAILRYVTLLRARPAAAAARPPASDPFRNPTATGTPPRQPAARDLRWNLRAYRP